MFVWGGEEGESTRKGEDGEKADEEEERRKY